MRAAHHPRIAALKSSELPMVDMLPPATDMDMPFQLMDMLLTEFSMVDMLLPTMDMDMLFKLMDMLLPELPMVNMLIIAMGINMLLLATDMDMLLPELPMVDMTDHAGHQRYECNPVFQIVTREICNLVLKFHNPMKNCGTR